MIGQQTHRRFDPQEGIAIGPILFIIAILAILAAAIAAGSGSFTSGTTTESDRTKASALVDIGGNLKVGMDRITMEGGLSPTGTAGPDVVDINASNTSLANALFSPVGGGIAPPSVGMSNNPAVDIWYYPQGIVQGMGTGTSNDVLAVLPVSQGVCAEINNRAVGVAVAPAAAALGNLVAGTVTGGTAWPTASAGGTTATGTAVSAGANLVGVATGCINDSDVTVGSNGPPSSTYFYYQVLAIQ